MMWRWIALVLVLGRPVWAAAPVEYEPTSDDVRRTMARYSHRIGRCYLDRKRANPKLEKRFVLNIELVPPGKVSQVFLSGVKARDALLEACAAFEVRSWKFPVSRSKKRMKVRYSYSFD